MTIAISSHGTLIARALASAPTVWTTIAEVGDVSYPALSRNEFDALDQSKNIDAYVLGVLRRGPLTLALNFLGTNAGHDHLTGLVKAMITEPPPTDGYKITAPDGVVWIMSGQVQNVAIKAPVDGKQAADVTIRLSGVMSIGGVSIG